MTYQTRSLKDRSLKDRQRKLRKVAVTRLSYDDRGRPSSWRVPCGGSCGGSPEHDAHTVRRFVIGGTEQLICDCPGAGSSFVCKHVMKVWDGEMRERGKSVSFWHSDKDALRQKRPMRTIQTARQIVYVTMRRK